jgi:hypothetical protein
MIFCLAGVLSSEEFLQADNVSTSFGCLSNAHESLLNIRLPVSSTG